MQCPKGYIMSFSGVCTEVNKYERGGLSTRKGFPIRRQQTRPKVTPNQFRDPGAGCNNSSCTQTQYGFTHGICADMGGTEEICVNMCHPAPQGYGGTCGSPCDRYFCQDVGSDDGIQMRETIGGIIRLYDSSFNVVGMCCAGNPNCGGHHDVIAYDCHGSFPDYDDDDDTPDSGNDDYTIEDCRDSECCQSFKPGSYYCEDPNTYGSSRHRCAMNDCECKSPTHSLCEGEIVDTRFYIHHPTWIGNPNCNGNNNGWSGCGEYNPQGICYLAAEQFHSGTRPVCKMEIIMPENNIPVWGYDVWRNHYQCVHDSNFWNMGDYDTRCWCNDGTYSSNAGDCDQSGPFNDWGGSSGAAARACRNFCESLNLPAWQGGGSGGGQGSGRSRTGGRIKKRR